MEQNSYIYNKVLNFRMWFKYGLKAQKLQKQHALKGQKLREVARPERAEAPSPGHRPGYNSSQQGAL